ncbi:hypothetical protein HZH66_007786 [Vespula vulgaris]|uniref:Uncharacterized protein n=1 Tax=Vespula vulgaris TaxID=7454 RepID=A0A834JUH8_VESVU|nr:hypothetical protein HZH66_007786 [Vespula vulgaris]
MWTNITKIPYYSISICYAWILLKSSFQNRDSRLELSGTSFSTLVEDKKERRYALSMEQRSKASPFGESRACARMSHPPTFTAASRDFSNVRRPLDTKWTIYIRTTTTTTTTDDFHPLNCQWFRTQCFQ